MLAEYATSPVPALTPLTGSNRRAAWDRRSPDRQRLRQTAIAVPELPATCRDCGTELDDRRRRFCDYCRRLRFIEQATHGRANAAHVLVRLRSEQRDPAHGGSAAVARGAKNAAHQQAVRAWKGERPDRAVFEAEILPGLRTVPIAELVAATGLAVGYCSLIRLGKRLPHPRHWEQLRVLADRDRQEGVR